jgi:hypothetical protein
MSTDTGKWQLKGDTMNVKIGSTTYYTDADGNLQAANHVTESVSRTAYFDNVVALMKKRGLNPDVSPREREFIMDAWTLALRHDSVVNTLLDYRQDTPMPPDVGRIKR